MKAIPFTIPNLFQFLLEKHGDVAAQFTVQFHDYVHSFYGKDGVYAMGATMEDITAATVIHKDTSEYGVGPFGSQAYGKQVLQWVRENYRPVKTLLAEPFSGSQFGIQLLRRTAKADS